MRKPSSKEMPARTRAYDRSGRLVGWAAAGVVAVALLAANTLRTHPLPYSQLKGPAGWPQPTNLIVQMLVVESWPTYRMIEIRWLAWGLGAAGLLALACLDRPAHADPEAVGQVQTLLMLAAAGLSVLVGVRALCSAVPLVGLTWTWQLTLGLIWMVALYAWSLKRSVQAMARAVALSLGATSAISLLYCIQVRQPYPNWPVGNVLLVTTGCLVGVFLLAAWAYARFRMARRTGRKSGYIAGVAVAALLVITAVVLSMAGRRAAVSGLAAGVGLILLLVLRRRAKLIFLAVVVALLAVAPVVGPRLLTTGRWQTVLVRAELYKATVQAVLARPAAVGVGLGPAHLAFRLMERMRPLGAESPRLFHGDLFDYVDSEPLQAIAELGLPLGLVYLALPLGGLVGFAIAYRRTQEDGGRLTVLGGGAALAAALAAEATSEGMRHPGTAMVVWALVGMGWACGARVGGFERLAERLRIHAPWTARRRGTAMVGAAGVLVSLVVVCLAFDMCSASHRMYLARIAWDQGQFAEADELLRRSAHLKSGGSWMAWQYLRGRANLARVEQPPTPAAGTEFRAKAADLLGGLVAACAAYQDAPVWLGRALNDPAQRKRLVDDFVRLDPYDAEARLTQAEYPDATPTEQLEALRLAIRNACVTGQVARMIAQAAQDPSAAPLLTRWAADARRALTQPEPAQWSDPLALESVRVAVVLAAQQGKVAEAYGLADQAATLCRFLSTDPWRNRLETVEMEVYLDQAWFGWLNQPEAARSFLAVLEDHLREVVHGPANSTSERMAAQFVAMLRLSQDRFDESVRALGISHPAAQRADLARMAGWAYARLVTLMGSRAPAGRIEAWTGWGRRLLGDGEWQRAVEMSAARVGEPWWFGVLGPD